MTDLNPQQQLAASHIEGPMLVLAGAGSGKTRVITCRIAHLLKLGVPSSEILALTFTNKAANEMRQRIKQLAHQSVWTSTFHSLGAHILRHSIAELGYKSDFTIYDERDSLHLLKACLAAKGHKQDKATLKSLKSAISNAKNALLSPQDLEQAFSSQFDHLLKEIFISYQAKLKEYNALDFDDLLYLPAQLFTSFPNILAFYQKRWSFICIDEYQDTNTAQYAITKSLIAKHKNLFVVGDPDQSIYSWRGADFRNILDFERDYPGATVISLEQNYRSTTHILEGANALIKQNESRYEKNLWSALGPGEKIKIYIAENEREEAHFVATQLADHFQKKILPLNECVIFYRTNAQSRPLEDVLLKFQLPYTIIGGISFYQRREIKDILSLLRMVISDSDFLSFARTINLQKRGIGSATLLKWQTAAEQAALPILVFCRYLINGSISAKLTSKQRQGLEDYLASIDALKNDLKQELPLKTLIAHAVEEMHYLDILKDDPETFEDRKENINELINKGAEWQEENPTSSLTAFLEEISLKAQIDESSSADAIQLMTLHNSKGLEFRVVFIVGLEEDLLPHLNAKDSSQALEEERRLLYVGMTRAKQLLHLSASSYRSIWGIPKVMRPSRFLDEIPQQYCFELNPKQDELSDEVSLSDGSGLAVGTAIIHRDFGKGTIKKVYETSLGTTYDVYFLDLNLTRSLVGKYAKFKVCSD
ncbi:MAG: UvrD-helicase domain-containing protein [Chlamydiota bacterium]